MFIKEIASQDEISAFEKRPLNPLTNYHNSSIFESEHVSQALDDYVRSTQRALEIGVHRGTGRIMVKVVSKEDGKFIREIPSEYSLNLAYKLNEISGALFNEKA
jgi:uncharacterized FlaG/YvyC family protein